MTVYRDNVEVAFVNLFNDNSPLESVTVQKCLLLGKFYLYYLS